MKLNDGLQRNSMPVILVAVGLLLTVPSLFAHHGLAQFDTTHIIALQGTVTDFQWIQPHAVIHADLKDEQGKVANWVLECGSPLMLGRHGWSQNSLKRGDRVTVFGFRAKDGSSYMSVGRIELADGKSLSGSP
jgi:hypothetical protein